MLSAILVMLLFSGCLEGAESGRQTPPQLRDGALIGNETAGPGIQIQECTKVLVRLLVPADRVEPFLPEGFVVRTLVPGFVYTGIDLFECDRASFNTSVIADVRMLETWVHVMEEISGEPQASVLVLESLVSAAGLHEAYSSAGVATRLADIDHAAVALPGGSSQASWRAQGDGDVLEFTLPGPTESSGEREETFDRWYAGLPPVHATVSSRFGVGPLTESHPVLIEAEGNSATGQVATVGQFGAASSEYRYGATYDYQFSTFSFRR